MALASAFWARYCLGTRTDGSVIEPNDPLWSDLQSVAEKTATDPLAWLEMRQLYGNLADNERFSAAFSGWMKRIHSEGIEAALDAYLA